MKTLVELLKLSRVKLAGRGSRLLRGVWMQSQSSGGEHIAELEHNHRKKIIRIGSGRKLSVKQQNRITLVFISDSIRQPEDVFFNCNIGNGIHVRECNHSLFIGVVAKFVQLEFRLPSVNVALLKERYCIRRDRKSL